MNNIFLSRCWSRTENICKVYASFSNFARCSMLWKLYFGYNGRIWAVTYVVSGIYRNKRNNWRCHILCTLLFKRSGKDVNNKSSLKSILNIARKTVSQLIDIDMSFQIRGMLVKLWRKCCPSKKKETDVDALVDEKDV